MKKFLFTFLLIISTFASALAQLTIEATDHSVVFPGENQYAIIIVLAPNHYNLSFKTSLDGDKSLIENVESKEVGARNEYTIVLDAKKTFGSKLIITSATHTNALEIPVELKANSGVKYTINDPSDPLTNEASRVYQMEADKFFSVSNYDRATDSYKACLDAWTVASTVDTAYVKRRLNDIQTIKSKSAEGLAAESISDYLTMRNAYNAALMLNPYDKDVNVKYQFASVRVDSLCASYKRTADKLLAQRKDLEAAETVLNKIVASECPESMWAKDALLTLDVEGWKNLKSRHTVTYEYAKGAALGFSSGNYNVDNSSGYLTLRLAPSLFEYFRMKENDIVSGEANLSFGWTIPLYHIDVPRSTNFGLWMFVGPGATAYTEIWDGGDEAFVEFAVSPEIGVLFKIPLPGVQTNQIALRYTFQYRYWLEKDYADIVGSVRNVIGIGFTF